MAVVPDKLDKVAESRKTDLKRVIAGMGEFQGLPLARVEPRTNEDFEFKLKAKFEQAKILLNFFETNREKFRQEDHFQVLFAKLASFSIKKEQLHAGQVKLALRDFAKLLEEGASVELYTMICLTKVASMESLQLPT